MERFVAIDGICAWPNLTLLPDGQIAAMGFDQPCHGLWEGDICCWISPDDGRSWTRQGQVSRHDVGTARVNCAAGLAHDDSLIVVVGGVSGKPPKPVNVYTAELKYDFKGCRFLESWVYRSVDAGHTWDRIGSICGEIIGEPSQHPIPFGDIIRLSNHRLAIAVYSSAKKGVYRLVSEDQGKTWNNSAVIIQDDLYHNETALLYLNKSCILAASRCEERNVLELFRSDNDGTVWSASGPLTLPGQLPGHLLQLQDGIILLVYGIRNRPFCGIGVRISKDGGGTWSAPAFLVNLEHVTDCGYPASVQTADGTLITAYYSKSIPSHQHYHMGVVRWHLEELFPR